MLDYPHYSNYDSVTKAMIAFGHILRSKGLNVGVQEVLDSLIGSTLGILEDKNRLRYALKALCCTSEEERHSFDSIFDWFWGDERLEIKGKTTYKNQSNIKKKTQGSLVMMGKGEGEEGEEDAKRVSGANAIHRLRKTDFSKIEAIDSQFLEELAIQLWQQMSLRLKRKLKAAPNSGRIDLRNTIRRSIEKGGDPFDLQFKRKKKQKKRLVILLDVSGSMDKYSFFLLRFICALRVHFERIEAFLFSTKLIRITEYLNAHNLQQTLVMLSMQADNWSSGTQIGACLKTFNEDYAKRILNGQSTVIILSDGLDTGEPEVLAEAVRNIRLRTRQLVWLNPLKGMQGYEPVQRGMSAALPEVDVFRSAHNLNSILALEDLLAAV